RKRAEDARAIAESMKSISEKQEMEANCRWVRASRRSRRAHRQTKAAKAEAVETWPRQSLSLSPLEPDGSLVSRCDWADDFQQGNPCSGAECTLPACAK